MAQRQYAGRHDRQASDNRFVAETNENPKPFVWTKNPDKIIAAVKRGAPNVRFDPLS
jgi:hypothetical protein